MINQPIEFKIYKMKIEHVVLIGILVFHGYCFAQDSEKCALADDACNIGFLFDLASNVAPTGLPSIGLPVISPYRLTNVIVPVFDGLIYLTLVDGECVGINVNTCSISKHETDVQKFERRIELLCTNITIYGSYKIETHPILCSLLGDVNGRGTGSLILENWYFDIYYPFDFVKRDDGQIYFRAKFDQSKWVSKVLKKATTTADSIRVNNRDVTKPVLRFINEFWRIIFDEFATAFHKISMHYYFINYNIIYNNIPASDYLSDDLNEYLNRTCYY